MATEEQIIAQELLNHRDISKNNFWYWLEPNKPVTLKDANKFLLASILDFQMRAEVVWENARRLAEDIFKDPENLWGEITSITLKQWMVKRKEYSLHRFPKGHERVWTIGKRIMEQYEGDARKIWENQNIETVLYRLHDLSVGEQISRMIVGGLIDTGQLKGKADVKVDIHVRRVLGRLTQGKEFSELENNRVIEVTRRMHPINPWLLDRPLYMLGKQLCEAKNPKCSDCFMSKLCNYHQSH